MPRYRFTDRMDLIDKPAPKDAAPAEESHTHIWLHNPPATRDRASPTSRPRQRDQEGAANEMPIATLRRFDEGGAKPYWVGREENGRMYCVRQESDGDLSLALVQGTGEEVGAGDGNPQEKLDIRRPPGSASHDSLDAAAYDRMVRRGWNGSDISDGFALTRHFASRMKTAFESQRRQAK
jgi:hypothetical protein